MAKRKKGSVKLTTIEELRKGKLPGRKHSRAVKVRVDDIVLDSRAEAARYEDLKFLAKAGKIRDLVIHPRFILTSSYVDADGHEVATEAWTADFAYVKCIEGTWRLVVEDVKAGQDNTASRRGRQLFREKYPGVRLFVNETGKRG